MKIVEIWKLYEASPMFCKDTTDKRRNAVKTIWSEFACVYWSKPIKSLTSDMIASWLCQRCRLCSNKTYNEYLRIIRQVLNAVLSKTGLHVNPANEVPVRRKDSISRKPYTMEQVEGILTAIDHGISIPYKYKTHGKVVEVMRPYTINNKEEVKLTIMHGAYCGMRLWDAVNVDKTMWDGEFLTYVPRKTQDSSGKEVVVPILDSRLREALEACEGQLTPNLLRMHERQASDLTRLYNRIFKACGLETQKDCVGRRNANVGGFHALRATFVTICAEKGVSIEVCRDLVGHTSCRTTEIYLSISRKRKALELSRIMQNSAS